MSGIFANAQNILITGGTFIVSFFNVVVSLLAGDYFQPVKMIENFIDDCLNFHDIFLNVKIYCKMSQLSLLEITISI